MEIQRARGGCIITVLPLWDLGKGHRNSFKEKTHIVSRCAAPARAVLLDVEIINIFTPYYVNLTLTWLFITFVVICRGALIKCTPHVFVYLDVFIYSPAALIHLQHYSACLIHNEAGYEKSSSILHTV